jgi:hypothetical protein
MIRRRLPARTTPEMIEAGFDALARSGVAEHLCEGDKFVIRNIFNARHGERVAGERTNLAEVWEIRYTCAQVTGRCIQ